MIIGFQENQWGQSRSIIENAVILSVLTQPSIGGSDGIARQGVRRDASMSQGDMDNSLDEPIAGERLCQGRHRLVFKWSRIEETNGVSLDR